jgi:hypothetical protein
MRVPKPMAYFLVGSVCGQLIVFPKHKRREPEHIERRHNEEIRPTTYEIANSTVTMQVLNNYWDVLLDPAFSTQIKRTSRES